jgi:hypothetical protein
MHPVTTRPVTTRPDAARPDAARPDAARPDAARPDAAPRRLRGGHHISMNPCVNCMALMLIPIVMTGASYMRMLRMTPEAFFFDE